MEGNEPWFYEYKLIYIDELADNYKTLQGCGVIYVEDGSYLGAMTALDNYYNEKNIVCINYLAPVLSGPIMEYDPRLNCLVEYANSEHSKNEFKYLFKGENVCE